MYASLYHVFCPRLLVCMHELGTVHCRPKHHVYLAFY